MTTNAVILNCGNHPDDEIAVRRETPGADLVRVKFNAGGSAQVDRINTRHKALAKTDIERATMWAVKAVTA